ncbi:MAG: SIMPL domain-containing protein [Terriglobales bacterium]
MKITLVTFCAVLVLALGTFAMAQSPTLNPEPNTVFVGADGKFETAPDTALIQFNISAQADNAKDAYDQAARQAEATRQVLRANGIDPKSAEIGFFSVNPQYDWKNPKHKVIGYQVTTSVSLKLKDFSKIGPVTQQLADASVGESQSLSYTLDSTEEAKGRAVADAYRRARNSAQALASASGRTLGELSYASVDTFENIRVVAPMQHRTMPMAMKAEGPAPTEEFSPQNVTVTAHVNAMFLLK